MTDPLPANIRDIIEGRRPDLPPAVMARYAALWADKAPPAPTRRELPCVHEGGVKRPCGSTTGDRAEARHVRECDIFGECARGEPVVAHVCSGCDRYDADPALGGGIPDWVAAAADNFAESPVGVGGWVYYSQPTYVWPDDGAAAYGKYGRVPWAMFRHLTDGTAHPDNHRSYPTYEAAKAAGLAAIAALRAGAPLPPPAPLSLAEIGPEGLSRNRSGYAFNAGMTRYKGRLLLAYRDGWSGSNVHVAELGEDYAVGRSVVLAELAGHPACNVGREDPRLFTFRGRLHVAFIGVERIGGGAIRTNQMYARLTDDLTVEEVFFPEYQYRQGWEKNWQFLEYSGELFCVYMVAPHVILHIQGNKAYPFTETVPAFPWSGGLLRGGAPPVLVGDRWYHWFHGRGRHPETGDDTYNVGVYTFEAHPPFRILSMTPDPLLWGDKAANAAHRDPNYITVAFPQGAILENGRWVVSMGWNDRQIMRAEWDAAAVDRAMGL